MAVVCGFNTTKIVCRSALVEEWLRLEILSPDCSASDADLFRLMIGRFAKHRESLKMGYTINFYHIRAVVH